ncbi:MAG: ATP phosphoribosyltransferase [Gammaproteobacteria bacterium]|nr:ATP phosphoribosyltransferase [Gammaproteobacteria bacterium]
MSNQSHKLTIALSKGRILKDSLPLLAAAGIELLESPDDSRKLIFDTSHPEVRILVIRASDVPTFVSYGAADMGVAGKDVLLENDVSNLYELVDLQIARCRLMLASLPDADLEKPRLKIATKYTSTTREWFAKQGRQVEAVKLYGSMELAPVVGLADAIVDVVESGNTLKENGLVTRDHIMDISSRLVVNRASMKMKAGLIQPIIDQVASAVRDKAA